jgi:hypothetical protein
LADAAQKINEKREYMFDPDGANLKVTPQDLRKCHDKHFTRGSSAAVPVDLSDGSATLLDSLQAPNASTHSNSIQQQLLAQAALVQEQEQTKGAAPAAALPSSASTALNSTGP